MFLHWTLRECFISEPKGIFRHEERKVLHPKCFSRDFLSAVTMRGLTRFARGCEGNLAPKPRDPPMRLNENKVFIEGSSGMTDEFDGSDSRKYHGYDIYVMT